MRFLRLATVACVLGSCATSAWAQYGLYGAPETLRLPQATQVPANTYPETSSYPGIAASVPQVVPSQTSYQPSYQPQTVYQPRAAAQYQYPGQTRAVAMYQPVAPAPVPVRNYPVTQPEPAAANPVLTEPGYNGGSGYGCADGCGTPCRGDACGGDMYGCDVNNCCPWYASLSTIVLGRSEGRRLWTSYADQHNVDQLTNTQDIHMPWSWGGEVQVGRRFCGCGDTWALEGTFWTTQSMNGYNSTINTTISPYLVSTPLQVSDLEFGGSSALAWFMGAGEQRLWRSDEFYDAEINLVRMRTCCGCNSPWEMGWSAGVRFFRFDESLRYGSVMDGYSWSEADGAYQAYLQDRITNNLIGAQLGFDLAYNFRNSLRCFISPKMGIYNNNMNQHFQANLGDGTAGSTPYGDFPVSATRNDIAFLSQIDVGLDWQFARNWSARVGYRVLAMTGIALADDQFPQYIVDVPEIEHIDNHSSLVLHGAFAGVTYNF